MISDFEDYGAGELFDVKVEGGKLTGRSKIRIYYNSSDYDEAYVVGFEHFCRIYYVLGGVRCQCHKWNVQPYFYDRGNRMCKYTD